MKSRTSVFKINRRISLALLTLFILAAQIFAASGIDPTFNTYALSYNVGVVKIDIYPDGKILVVQGETFDRVNGVKRNGIARLNADGSLDESFNPINTGITPASISAIKALPDGKTLLGGSFYNSNGTFRSAVIRLNNDGTIDTSFQTGAFGGTVNNIEIQPDGKILIGGFFRMSNGSSNIARLNSDGSLDTTFVGNVSFRLISMTVLTNGKIVFATQTPKSGTWFYRLNSNGSFDAELPAYNFVSSFRALPDGKLLVNGSLLRRLNADGSIDPAFSQSTGSSSKILTTADNKILIIKNNSLVRLNADGTVDSTFVSGSNITVPRDFALQPDGRIIVAGQAPQIAPPAVPRAVIRLLPDGSLDTSFNTILYWKT